MLNEIFLVKYFLLHSKYIYLEICNNKITIYSRITLVFLIVDVDDAPPQNENQKKTIFVFYLFQISKWYFFEAARSLKNSI